MLVASLSRWALLALAISSAAACTKEEVPLGAWGTGGGAGQDGAGGGGADGGGRLCGEVGAPGPFSIAGDGTAITLTYTDWTWSTPVDSLEWDLLVESEFQNDGYFWAHEFDFVGSPGGFLGLQSRGGFQADPPDGPVDTTNMVVFWLSSSPLAAELGDVAYPNARAYHKTDAGDWWTIHVRYDFESCRTYRLRVGRHSTDGAGNIWYGAWIRDTVSGVETFLGRILVRASFGQLAAVSSMFSNRIGYGALSSCASPEPASARFGVPSANGGTVRPASHENRFAEPRSCPTSRFTELADGVRHEIGLLP